MQKYYIFSLVITLVVVVLSSCSTTNKVTSDNLIQKRKYRPSYYVQSPFQYIKKEKNKDKDAQVIADEQRNKPEFVSKNEVVDNETLIASINDDPLSIVQTNSVLDNMKELYNSDIKDINAFRKEYHKTTKEFGKNLGKINPKKKDMMEKNSPLKHVGGGFSIASFVLGIIGFITQGYVCGVLAIVFGIIGLVRGRRKGLAVFGLIFGILDIIGASLALTLFIP